mmetsp:Transcript_28115/g.65367  ORF Transcript_28115/g.65367 Transcript_28115/m.65367 type:complete len:236 (+) Transcript_28115:867-1574(+)
MDNSFQHRPRTHNGGANPTGTDAHHSCRGLVGEQWMLFLQRPRMQYLGQFGVGVGSLRTKEEESMGSTNVTSDWVHNLYFAIITGRRRCCCCCWDQFGAIHTPMIGRTDLYDNGCCRLIQCHRQLFGQQDMGQVIHGKDLIVTLPGFLGSQQVVEAIVRTRIVAENVNGGKLLENFVGRLGNCSQVIEIGLDRDQLGSRRKQFISILVVVVIPFLVEALQLRRRSTDGHDGGSQF